MMSMKIEFEITEVPKSEQMKYATAYVEGELKITVSNHLFFCQPGILLIELASFMKNWLDRVKRGHHEDFVYETMDHDEPIITIRYVDENGLEIDSIWRETQSSECVLVMEVTKAFENYLSELEKALENLSGIRLQDVLDHLSGQ